MADKSHDQAEALLHALHLALQIDPDNTTDPIVREAWYTATLFQSAFDCYQKAAARVNAVTFDLAFTIAQEDADYWASEVKRLSEHFLQLARPAAARREGSA